MTAGVPSSGGTPISSPDRASFSFSFEIEGEEQLRTTLFRYQARLGDFEPAFNAIADDFTDVEKRHFLSQGARGERGPWEPLTTSTKAGKQATHPEHRNDALVASGELLKSLTDPNHKNHVREIDEESMAVGTKDQTAIFHHFGTEGPYEINGNPYLAFELGSQLIVSTQVEHPGLPSRPVIDLNEQDRERWIRILQSHVFLRDDNDTAPTGKVSETPFALNQQFTPTRFEV